MRSIFMATIKPPHEFQLLAPVYVLQAQVL
jgi:hypothetical protein